MPNVVAAYLKALLSAEKGALSRPSVFWSLAMEGFTDTQIMAAMADARSLQYTATDNWGPDQLTDTGRARASTV